MEIYLAHTQGFCVGVSRAIDIVNRALKKYGTPLYVFHEIVHNTVVVNDFKKKGITFVDTLDEIPCGARVIFSAHGVSPSVVGRSQGKRLYFIDATCPLVKCVHRQAQSLSDQGVHVVLIGHAKHEEIVGTQGYVKPELLHIVQTKEQIDNLDISGEASVGCVTQTTLSVDDTKLLIDHLKKRFPNLIKQSHNSVCYATQIRQDAVKELSQICNPVLVCGSQNSSNSNRLKELASTQGVESYLIDRPDDFSLENLRDKRKIGISSGASVPDAVVKILVDRIKLNFDVSCVHISKSREKEVGFSLPEI